MQNPKILKTMQTANATPKRPIAITLRDRRTGQYNTTYIMAEANDPRPDYEIAKLFKQRRKQSELDTRNTQASLKLTKCNGFLPSSGKLYRSEDLNKARKNKEYNLEASLAAATKLLTK